MNAPLEIYSALASVAVSRFHRETGIPCTWTPKLFHNKENPIVGHVSFTFPTERKRYAAVIKAKVTRATVLLSVIDQRENDHERLLITTRLTDEMANQCRKLGLQFIDAAGNAFIKNKELGIFVFIKGQQMPATSDAKQFQDDRVESNTTPAALRTIFSLFAKPDLLNAPIRSIAAAAGVSVGSAVETMHGLRARGFIGTDGAGDSAFIDRDRLVLEWSGGFVNRLRPKLNSQRYAFEEDADMYLPGWLPEGAAWGGEPAAAILTHHLKPASFTIYADIAKKPMILAHLGKQLRIRLDPQGPLEIVQSFWDASLEIRDVVPPELVFADLVMTSDPRNHDIAQMINKTLIKNA